MALNEQIVEETRYYRQCVDKDNKKWERYGLWNRGKDTECEDGNTVETKVGAIKGITTSTNVSETGYAADAKTVSEINQSLRELNEGMIYNDVRTGVVTVLPNSDISISDNTPINFKDYVPLATTIIATYGSSDAHSHGMLGSPAIKDNTTCCVRYKNLTESELKVDFTVRFYYLRNN